MLAQPKNVALISVYGETPPYSVEAVKVCMLLDTLDTKSLLMGRTTRLKHFSLLKVKKLFVFRIAEFLHSFGKLSTTTDQTNAELGG